MTATRPTKIGPLRLSVSSRLIMQVCNYRTVFFIALLFKILAPKETENCLDTVWINDAHARLFEARRIIFFLLFENYSLKKVIENLGTSVCTNFYDNFSV